MRTEQRALKNCGLLEAHISERIKTVACSNCSTWMGVGKRKEGEILGLGKRGKDEDERPVEARRDPNAARTARDLGGALFQKKKRGACGGCIEAKLCRTPIKHRMRP